MAARVFFSVAAFAAAVGASASADTSDHAPLKIGFFPSQIFTTDPEHSALYQEVLFFKQVGQTLVEAGPMGELLPGLARSWTISPDRRDYRFELRDDVKFHDGTPLTAPYVVDALNRAIYSKYNTIYLYFQSVAGLEQGRARGRCPGIIARGPTTLEIRLAKPYAPLLKVLASGLTAIFKKRVGQEPLVGSGPYKVQAEKGGQPLLVAYKDYKGIYPPKIPRIALIADTDTLFGRKAPSKDALPDFDVFVPFGLQELYDSDRYVITRTPHLATTGFYVNTREKALAPLEERQRLLGLMLKAARQVPASTPGSVLTDLYPRGMLAHNDSRKSWQDYVRTLEAAGDVTLPKIRVATFGPIVGDTERFRSELQKLTRAEVEIVALDPANVRESIRTSKFDVIHLVWHSILSDPHAQITALSLVGTLQGPFDPPKIRKLIEDSVADTLDNERTRLYGEIADWIFGNALVVPVFQRDHIRALSKAYKTSDFIYRYQPMFSEVQPK